MENTKKESNVLYTMLGTVNLCDRTQKQQENIEDKLLKAGSLWPRFDVMHRFIFTRKELNDVKKAKAIIDQHKSKCNALNCA